MPPLPMTATGLGASCAVCTMVQLFTIGSCFAFAGKWLFAICGCPRGSHGAIVRRIGGPGPLTMTSTMPHFPTFYNQCVTSCHRATTPSYKNIWCGTNTMSYLGSASTEGNSPCCRATCCHLLSPPQAFRVVYQAAAPQSPTQRAPSNVKVVRLATQEGRSIQYAWLWCAGTYDSDARFPRTIVPTRNESSTHRHKCGEGCIA